MSCSFPFQTFGEEKESLPNTFELLISSTNKTSIWKRKFNPHIEEKAERRFKGVDEVRNEE